MKVQGGQVRREPFRPPFSHFPVVAVGLLWLSASCLGLTIVSAILPWVNAEVILLSMVAMTPTWPGAAWMVVVATAGQMLGKCAVYWTSHTVRPHRSVRVAAALDRFQARLEDKPSRASALFFLSSALGFPPFFLVTVAAGALRVHFGRFIVAGTIGRLVRFSVLAASLHFMHTTSHTP
jgi:membrane protein YqaA with SNARE-associated domain